MDALLPEDPQAAQRFNAGMMELGALVCTSSSPRCDDCPIAGLCAWRQAGYPRYTGARRPVQKRYEGSDRQVRGVILHEFRAADARGRPAASWRRCGRMPRSGIVRSPAWWRTDSPSRSTAATGFRKAALADSISL